MGIFWRVDRDSGQLRLDPPYGRQRNLANEIHNVILKTFRADPKDRLGVVMAAHKTLVDRTQYLRQAGADDREVWAEAYEQLLRFARWRGWPIDRTEEERAV